MTIIVYMFVHAIGLYLVSISICIYDTFLMHSLYIHDAFIRSLNENESNRSNFKIQNLNSFRTLKKENLIISSKNVGSKPISDLEDWRMEKLPNLANDKLKVRKTFVTQNGKFLSNFLSFHFLKLKKESHSLFIHNKIISVFIPPSYKL